jgi:hypothetical protein
MVSSTISKKAKLLSVLLLVLPLMAAAGSPSVYAQNGALLCSEAFGVLIDLTITPFIGNPRFIGTGMVPFVGDCNDGGDYDLSDSAASQVVKVPSSGPRQGKVLDLGIGALTVNASSNTAQNVVSADSTINNLNFKILGSLLTVDSASVMSFVKISGDCGEGLSYEAGTFLENFTIGGLIGVLIGFVPILIEPTPNLVAVDNLFGITIVLNEQIVEGDGAGDLSVTVNAVHVIFDNAIARLITLDGEIIVGSSYASKVCEDT